MNPKNLKLLLKVLLGVALIVLIYSKIGFGEIIDTILKVNLTFLILYALLKAMTFLFSTFNIAVMLIPSEKKVEMRDVLRFSMLSWSMGLFVPGRLGELSFVYFLKKKGVPVPVGLTIFFLDRLLTFIVLFILGLFAVILFSPDYYPIYLVFFLCIMGGFIILITKESLLEKILKRFLKKYAKYLVDFKKTLVLYLREYPHLVLINFIITFVKWLFVAFCIYILFAAFGVRVPFFSILVIQSLVTFVSLIPVTFNGLGVKEPVAIYMYSLLGVTYATTASLYALALFVTLSLGAIFLLLFLKKE